MSSNFYAVNYFVVISILLWFSNVTNSSKRVSKRILNGINVPKLSTIHEDKDSSSEKTYRNNKENVSPSSPLNIDERNQSRRSKAPQNSKKDQNKLMQPSSREGRISRSMGDDDFQVASSRNVQNRFINSREPSREGREGISKTVPVPSNDKNPSFQAESSRNPQSRFINSREPSREGREGISKTVPVPSNDKNPSSRHGRMQNQLEPVGQIINKSSRRNPNNIFEPESSVPTFSQNPSSQYGRLQKDSWEIVYTAFILRHGIRESERVVTFTPKEKRRWSNGVGTLTQAGKNGIRMLGDELKIRYASLLEHPSKTNIRAFSTSVHRTVETTKLLLGQIFGQNRGKPDIINYQIRWATADRMKYSVALNSVNENQFKDYERTLFRVVYEKVKYFFPYLQLEDLYSFIDTMLCEHANGVKLPQEILDLMETFHRYKYWLFSKQHSTLYLMQVKAAPYLSDIVKGMKKIVEGKRTAAKLEIFTTHDSYLQTIMKALDPLPPFDGYFKTDFASAIIFELYRSPYYKANTTDTDKNYIVKIRYNHDASLLDVVPVPLFDCQHRTLPADLQRETEPFCFLDEFFATLRKFTMDKFEYLELASGRKCRNLRSYNRIISGFFPRSQYKDLIIPS